MSRHEIGVDLVDIDRIVAVLQRFPNRFRDRVLTPAEARYCGRKAERIAGRWAAKEAWEIEDRDKTGVLVLIRDRFRHLRRSVIDRNWHRRPVLGRPLRCLGKHLP